MDRFEGVSWAEGECRHETGVEGRIVVWAASVVGLWVATVAGVQGTAGFAVEKPESQRGCEVESQK